MGWIGRLFAKKDKPEMKIPEKMGPEMIKALIAYRKELEGWRWGTWQYLGIVERGRQSLIEAARLDWENEQKVAQSEISPSE